MYSTLFKSLKSYCKQIWGERTKIIMKRKSFYASIIVIWFFLIGIQSTAYSTIFLSSSGWHDDNGNDPGIGTWDPITLTGTLTKDLDDPVHKNIQIDDSGITLDGAGHTIYSALFSYGINSDNTTDITIKNIRTENAYAGISLVYCSNSIITGSTLSNGHLGIELGSSNITVEKNIIKSNDVGIILWEANHNKIEYNQFLHGNIYGIYMLSSNNNTVINNNFTDNPTQAINYYGTDNIWNLASPIGGNYWSS